MFYKEKYSMENILTDFIQRIFLKYGNIHKYFSWKLLFKNMIQAGEIRSAKLGKKILSYQFL